MNWLQCHEYIATWLSPVMTVIAILLSRFKKGTIKRVLWVQIFLWAFFILQIFIACAYSLSYGVRITSGITGFIVFIVIALDMVEP
jgi:hypothetical protein